MSKEHISSHKGFGLLEIIVVVAIIALLIGGGVFFGQFQHQQSMIDVGRKAEERAEELVKKINTPQNNKIYQDTK